MAQIKLVVKTNLEQASKQTKAFTEAATKSAVSVEKLQQKFKGKGSNQFSQALAHSSKNLGTFDSALSSSNRKVSSLTKALGATTHKVITPQSRAVGTLRTSYTQLNQVMGVFSKKAVQQRGSVVALRTSMAGASLSALSLSKGIRGIGNALSAANPYFLALRVGAGIILKLGGAAALLPKAFSGIQTIAQKHFPRLNSAISSSISKLEQMAVKSDSLWSRMKAGVAKTILSLVKGKEHVDNLTKSVKDLAQAEKDNARISLENHLARSRNLIAAAHRRRDAEKAVADELLAKEKSNNKIILQNHLAMTRNRIAAAHRRRDAEKAATEATLQNHLRIKRSELDLLRIRKENRAQFLQSAMARGNLMATRGLIGIGAAAAGVSVGFVKAAASIESATARFQPLLGGVEKATQLVKMLNKEAATTPFQFEGIANVVTQLLPEMQGNLQKTIKTFRMLGDTAGGDMGRLQSISSAFVKVLGKGKVEMDQLNQIMEGGGIPIFRELAKTMGVTTEVMFEMLGKGEIGAEQLTKTFERMTAENGIYFKGMEIASKTFDGLMSTLKDSVKVVGGSIGQHFLPQIKSALTRVIEFVTSGEDFITFLEKAKDWVGFVASALFAYKATLMIATAAQVIFNTSLNPLFAVGFAASIVAAGTALAKYGINLEDAAKSQEDFAKGQKESNTEVERANRVYRKIQGAFNTDISEATKVHYRGMSDAFRSEARPLDRRRSRSRAGHMGGAGGLSESFASYTRPSIAQQRGTEEKDRTAHIGPILPFLGKLAVKALPYVIQGVGTYMSYKAGQKSVAPKVEAGKPFYSADEIDFAPPDEPSVSKPEPAPTTPPPAAKPKTTPASTPKVIRIAPRDESQLRVPPYRAAQAPPAAGPSPGPTAPRPVLKPLGRTPGGGRGVGKSRVRARAQARGGVGLGKFAARVMGSKLGKVGLAGLGISGLSLLDTLAFQGKGSAALFSSLGKGYDWVKSLFEEEEDEPVQPRPVLPLAPGAEVLGPAMPGGIKAPFKRVKRGEPVPEPETGIWTLDRKEEKKPTPKKEKKEEPKQDLLDKAMEDLLKLKPHGMRQAPMPSYVATHIGDQVVARLLTHEAPKVPKSPKDTGIPSYIQRMADVRGGAFSVYSKKIAEAEKAEDEEETPHSDYKKRMAAAIEEFKKTSLSLVGQEEAGLITQEERYEKLAAAINTARTEVIDLSAETGVWGKQSEGFLGVLNREWAINSEKVEANKSALERVQDTLDANVDQELLAQSKLRSALEKGLNQRVKLKEADVDVSKTRKEIMKEELESMLELFKDNAEAVRILQALLDKLRDDEALSAAKKQLEEMQTVLSNFSEFSNTILDTIGSVSSNQMQQEMTDLDEQIAERRERDREAEEGELAAVRKKYGKQKKIRRGFEKETYDIKTFYANKREKDDKADEKAKRKREYDTAVQQKGLAVAMASITGAISLASTMLNAKESITKAAAIAGPPGMLAMAAAIAPIVVAAVAAFGNIAKAATIPLPAPPGAETGGRFVVPPSAGATPDNVGLRVNPGETVDVLPRGEEAEPIQLNIFIDGTKISEFIQDRIDSRDITINMDNIVRV